MSGMTPYYLSRLAIAVFLVGFLVLMGSPWWIAGPLGLLVVAYFVWVPRSGRFVSSGVVGATPLRRDEWAQTITYRSGLYGFVVLMLSIGAVIVYYGSILGAEVPVTVVSLAGVLGMGTYIVSDVALRRA